MAELDQLTVKCNCSIRNNHSFFVSAAPVGCYKGECYADILYKLLVKCPIFLLFFYVFFYFFSYFSCSNFLFSYFLEPMCCLTQTKTFNKNSTAAWHIHGTNSFTPFQCYLLPCIAPVHVDGLHVQWNA